ncbi:MULTISPECIES: aminotransferase class IV family protein [unclassified Ruegeria]|uniref:aminotransferase class IV family protein n=1 Tax=unclassified Ruegeria TaxID=2625375 RepID=UPI00148915E4|nr:MULTISPECIES: aminotransferase class IV family protein [unclassified Ruegeria]NOD35292.1 4-amino-4-deoxychorismate lyase [Ruegeria sp. HKCCD7296]NOD49059.1 4-amino-4-deoxychorismate lyase [Ruegeria sp. HKCCD5849]NOD53706.1 4-amino-4-deoxychorismate lyase [Ruegeria sp. HKCCD5851]NOD69582.1 4-amino-4-deoxychorismate lyase [Ruegeria sp. HKCCD7303]NOE32389.1 4-amino-4-deoxychorismate lyase [Ruegeria sp. HKCCD7318]
MESPLCPANEPDFRLIETLAFRPDEGFVRQGRHLARMARTARVFGFPFDLEEAVAALTAAKGETALRCRLTLDSAGAFDLTIGALAENPPVWRVAVSENRLASNDLWLRHKTTHRALYDSARAALPAGIDELLFLNELGELCEGTITNLFAKMPDGRFQTPTLSCGLLPGILREELLDKETVTEAVLTLTDLKNAQTVYVGNSLRGLIRVELIDT